MVIESSAQIRLRIPRRSLRAIAFRTLATWSNTFLRSLRSPLQISAVLSLIGSAVLHFAQVRTHLSEWRLAGVFFFVLAVVQVAVALRLLTSQSRKFELFAIVISIGAIALWAVSRTTGLPIGPEAGTPEAIGQADIASKILELVTAVSLFVAIVISVRRRNSTRIANRCALSIVVLALPATTYWGLVTRTNERCASSHGRDSPTGPLAPVDGHSILPRGFGPITMMTGQRVGLASGLLLNCATEALTVESVGRLDQVGTSARVTAFWILPNSFVNPGRGVSIAILHRYATKLPGHVAVPPTSGEPEFALVAEILAGQRDRAYNGVFTIDSLQLNYSSDGHRYHGLYVTVAQVSIAPNETRRASTP